MARRCLQEVEERAMKDGGRSNWEKEREQFFEERRVGIKEWERKRRQGEIGFEVVKERDRERQREERWKKIGRSKFNKWYGMVKGMGIPEYFKKGWGEKRWKRIESLG